MAVSPPRKLPRCVQVNVVHGHTGSKELPLRDNNPNGEDESMTVVVMSPDEDETFCVFLCFGGGWVVYMFMFFCWGNLIFRKFREGIWDV